MKHRGRLLAGVMAGLLLSLRAPSMAQPEPFDIYAILSLTGSGAFLGKEEGQTLHALEGLVNKRGGINGTPIRFVLEDDTSNPQVALQLANATIARNVAAVLGPTIVPGCSAIAPLFKAGPVQYCLAPGIYPSAGSYTFAAGVSSMDFVTALFRYMRAQRWTKIALMIATDAAGQEGERVIDANLTLPENKGVTIVSRQYFNDTDISTTAQMSRIAADHPDAIIAWAVGTPFGTVLRGYADAGLKIPVFTNAGNVVSAQMEQYASFAPKALYFAAFRYLAYPTERSSVVKSKQREFFSTLTQSGVGTNTGAAIVWDTASVILDAFKHLGVKATAAQVHEYIEQLHGFVGINGNFDFRGGNQRGLTIDSAIVVHWDEKSKAWIPLSQPGGNPLR